jgi:hypothetical protein
MVPLLVIPETQQLRELKRAEAHAAYERQRWREKLVILVIIAFWNLVGLWVIGMSMATTDPVRGEALMVLGTFLGYGGMALSLLLYLVRLAGRGES